MDVRTIDDVVARLEEIIETAEREGSRLGYFAALYRNMTLHVKAGILNGQFQDADRMERLDVCFATRYVEAYEPYRAGGLPTDAWRVAFEAAEQDRLTIVQHLLLGINAHINLDLGIAAAEIAPGAAIDDLKADFDQINNIISGLIDTVEAEIGAVSPWINLLHWVAGRNEKAIINFSIGIARYEAWQLACALAAAPQPDWGRQIGQRDQFVAGLGQRVISPGVIVGTVSKVIGLLEPRDAGIVIRVLNSRAPEMPAATAKAPGAETAASMQGR